MLIKVKFSLIAFFQICVAIFETSFLVFKCTLANNT